MLRMESHAEIEEVVLDADALHTEHVGPGRSPQAPFGVGGGAL